MLSFKPTFSVSSFTFIKRLFSSSSLSVIRLDEAHTRIKIVRRNINNLRYADETIVMAESKEELKSLLKLRVKKLT